MSDIITEIIEDELTSTPMILHGYINNLNIVKAQWARLPWYKKIFTDKREFFNQKFLEMEVLSQLNKITIPKREKK